VPGTHATAELLPSLLGLGKNTLWENAYQWFDIHLKKETNALSRAKPVQMEIKLQDKFDGFDQFPIAEAKEKTFYLHPRYLLHGNLESKPYNRMLGRENTIFSIGKAWGFSTQVPLISQILDQNDVPTLASVALASLVRGIYFHTDRLDRVMKIRGNPSVTVQLQPTSRKVQLVAYLYDIDTLFNVDKLITHGVITLPDATPGETVTAAFELVTTAYDVPAGHRVALAFDTGDPQYQAPTEKPYRLNFKFSRKTQSVLQLPVL
jgi:predicted acyl esterase